MESIDNGYVHGGGSFLQDCSPCIYIKQSVSIELEAQKKRLNCLSSSKSYKCSALEEKNLKSKGKTETEDTAWCPG